MADRLVELLRQVARVAAPIPGLEHSRRAARVHAGPGDDEIVDVRTF